MTALSAALLFFMLTITGYSIAEFIRIERDSSLKHDDFLLPSSRCIGNEPQCDSFNSSVLSVCWCYCEDLQGQTTAFYDSSYGCLQVSDVRQQAGCQMLFTGESADQRLAFFPSGSVQEQAVSVPANQSCTFYYGYQFFAQYLDCTGSWRSIESQNVLDTIELTPGWSSSQLKIRIKAGTTLFQNITAGRLVKVAIQCRHDTPGVQFTNSCVVFQVHGTIECPYPRPTLSAETPSSEEATTVPSEGTTVDGTGDGEGAETGKRKENHVLKTNRIFYNTISGTNLAVRP